MRIDISLFAIGSKMRINSISHASVRQSRSPFQKNSPSVKVNPILTDQLIPFQRSLPFCQSRNIFVSRIFACRNGPSPRRVQPDKNWLKAKDSVKQTSLSSAETSAPTVSERSIIEGDVLLKENEAIGLVVAAQANFMRVIVEKAGDEALEEEAHAIESPSVQFRFSGNGAEPTLLKNSDTGACDLRGSVRVREGRDISKQSLEVAVDGSNGQTSGEGVETSVALAGYNESDLNVDNGHSRTSGGRIDRGNGTLIEDENSNTAVRVKARGLMGAKAEGHMREEPDYDDDNSKASSLVQKNTQDGTWENIKENEHLVTGLKKSLDTKVGTELLCVVRALLKKMRRRVLVGDKVLVGGINWTDKRGMIEYALKRKTELVDPPVANVDHLLLLFSMEQPKPEPFTLTRFLVDAESTEIPFTLVLNKSDLVQEEVMHMWRNKLQTWGYQPLFCSADSNVGLPALANVLENRTTVVVGPSGVGKSSLINALRHGLDICVTSEMNPFAGQVGDSSKWFEKQRVGEISERSGRGKHTTRNVSLLPLLAGGFLADTPGQSQPSLLKVTKSSLAWMFPEIRQMLNASGSGGCNFKDCLHIGEPGCAVKGDWERYPYYLQLLDEIKIREEIQLRLLGTKRESDVRYKVREMGVKQAEPKLEPKKHRRLSRKRINQSILDEVMEEIEDMSDQENV